MTDKVSTQSGPSKSGPTQGDFGSGQWVPRPMAAHAVAMAVRGAPILGSVVAGLIAARTMPRPTGLGWVLWIAVVVGSSQIALAVVERAVRSLLPLSTMLRFSLVFPDQAPSRFASALRSGNVEKMRREMEETAKNGLPINLQEAVETALAMVAALNKHDRGTRGHSERVRAYSEMLAEEMGLDRTFRDKLRWGALLHDMGKLTVPPEILNKNGRPTEDEWAVLQRHPAEGERILAPLADWLGDAAHAAGQHHERWDGKGYPRGLATTEVALSARIVAVADAFAVMTAARSYKKPLPLELARQELTKNAGTQFDPAVVRAMLSVSVGKMSRTAGFLAPLANVPFVGSLIASAPSVPAIMSSGAAAIAITASLAAPSSPLQWANPFPLQRQSEQATMLALTDQGDRLQDELQFQPPIAFSDSGALSTAVTNGRNQTPGRSPLSLPTSVTPTGPLAREFQQASGGAPGTSNDLSLSTRSGPLGEEATLTTPPVSPAPGTAANDATGSGSPSPSGLANVTGSAPSSTTTSATTIATTGTASATLPKQTSTTTTLAASTTPGRTTTSTTTIIPTTTTATTATTATTTTTTTIVGQTKPPQPTTSTSATPTIVSETKPPVQATTTSTSVVSPTKEPPTTLPSPIDTLPTTTLDLTTRPTRLPPFATTTLTPPTTSLPTIATTTWIPTTTPTPTTTATPTTTSQIKPTLTIAPPITIPPTAETTPPIIATTIAFPPLTTIAPTTIAPTTTINSPGKSGQNRGRGNGP